MPELDPQLVDRALAEATKRAANLDYFFDRLSSADWIEPLHDRGLFSEPPTQFVDEQGYVRAPAWSASRYLARVASDAPDAVLETIRRIRTDNERVHEDFVDAALAMPHQQAREIAMAESAWFSSRDHLYFALPEKLTELAEKMVTEDDIEAAIELVRAVFIPTASASPSSQLRRPRARFSAFQYDELLQRVVAAITPAAAGRLLEELAGLLAAALDIMRDEEQLEPFDALSRIRRPTIAGDGNRSREIEESLVSGVRDAAVQIRRAQLTADDELLRILTSRPEEIFRRLAMYALAQPPEPHIDDVRGLVVDPAAFAHGEPSVEYRLLLSQSAPRLEPDDIEVLLDVVHEGPDIEAYTERATRFGRSVPTDEEVRDYVASWQAARLKLLAPALDQEWTERYDALVSQVGDVELPTSGIVASFVGPTSPFTAAQLASMGDAELLDALCHWQPEDRWDAPSAEGLGRAIGEVAQQDPVRLTSLLGELRRVRPEYIEHVLRGFREALRDGRGLAWAEVIDFVSWLVDESRSREETGEMADTEKSAWMLARRTAAFLLDAGLVGEDEAKPPIELREPVWHAIDAIATDADPTQAHEEQYGGSNMDPLTLSLNTTRPRALAAAIAYAIWLHRISSAGDGLAAENATLTTEAPEVGDLLLAHLDPDVDPSSSVRAAIAQRFTNLFAVDPEWSTSHADALFPHDDTPLREAAWGAYIIYSTPYDEVLQGLRDVYERSADLAGSPGHGFRWMNADPRSRLGQHIMAYYWRGVIDLNDQLISTFWERAPISARTDALSFVGRTVAEVDELDPAVEQRLERLWDFAVEHSSPAPAAELGAFAWWFPAAALRVGWRLNQLLTLLETRVRPDPGFLVARALPEMTREEPRATVRALRGLLEVERGSWTITAWREDIERILDEALKSHDREARRLAEDTVHLLGALGYREYRSLLR